MIGGLVLHDGHPALAIHLARTDDNERVIVRTNGLSATTIANVLAELRLMALGTRTRRPIIHSWASPSKTYSDADWERHREEFEAEFGLVGFPCMEVSHVKFGEGGRTACHVHRVHLRIDPDGRAVSTSHSAARQEKNSRISEFQAGERFTSGVFNRSIIERLRAEGRIAIAEAMVRAGLDKTIAAPAPTSAERQMAERLEDLATDEVWRRCALAWRRSETGMAFVEALAESGLRLALGDKCQVVVTPTGAAHPLLRAINKGGERQNGQAIRKTDLAARLKDVVLPAAGDLPTVASFGAGVYSIFNLDRVPMSDPAHPAPVAHEEAAAKVILGRTPDLTVEQEAALAELDNAFHSAAALQAQEIRQQSENQIVEEVRRRRHEALRQRLEAEQDSWALPGIGVPGWRDRYRADLAGLPAQYGPRLKWVQQLDAERRRVILKSGATLILAPARTWTTQLANLDAIPVMIAHARRRGWSSTTVTGNPEWREEMARAATRAGLKVVGEELQDIVASERLHMHQEALVASWLDERAALARSSEETRQEALSRLLRVLKQIAEDETDLVGRILDPGEQRALASDLIHYRRITHARARKWPPSPAHRAPGFGTGECKTQGRRAGPAETPRCGGLIAMSDAGVLTWGIGSRFIRWKHQLGYSSWYAALARGNHRRLACCGGLYCLMYSRMYP